MPKSTKQSEGIQQTPEATSKLTYYEAVGRRKEASARVRLYVIGDDHVNVGGIPLEKGSIVVNGKKADTYFTGDVNKKIYLEPFRTTNTINRFATSVKVSGGGSSGQLAAFIHAVSRALLKVDSEKFRPILKKRGFLTRDPRAKQRRKAGFAHKARARKQSPKR